MLDGFLMASHVRPQWGGGRYTGDESSRLEALRLAVELGADFIDIELEVCLISLLLSAYMDTNNILRSDFLPSWGEQSPPVLGR
jgi:3-dehydroquinate dehydratase